MKILNGKIKIRVFKGDSLPREISGRRWPNRKGIDPKIIERVEAIIDEIRGRGDSALIDFTKKFDGVRLSPEDLRVKKEEIERAYERVDDRLISAIEYSKSSIEPLQREILNRLRFTLEDRNVKIKVCVSPIHRIGCYVPGGEASYPSTLIMTVTPAKIAGVSEIAICSPPNRMGEVAPSILVAADICGVNEIYKIGGAQAIAALAYGTETIRPVEKIFGPGNIYVQTAKILVSKDLPIDVPAGPSEIAIIADEKADPYIIALDMISQAEHTDASSVLVTTSSILAENVVRMLSELIDSLPNSQVISENLRSNGLIIICKDMREAIRVINEFAPEHLEILSEDAWDVAEKIESAGLILVGAYTPVAASDYCLGTIHVLPTGGFSRIYSGLSVLDFIRHFCIVESSKSRLMDVRDKVRILAENEGLINHSFAVEGRFRSEYT